MHVFEMWEEAELGQNPSRTEHTEKFKAPDLKPQKGSVQSPCCSCPSEKPAVKLQAKFK